MQNLPSTGSTGRRHTTDTLSALTSTVLCDAQAGQHSPCPSGTARGCVLQGPSDTAQPHFFRRLKPAGAQKAHWMLGKWAGDIVGASF